MRYAGVRLTKTTPTEMYRRSREWRWGCSYWQSGKIKNPAWGWCMRNGNHTAALHLSMKSEIELHALLLDW